ncbi:hypothetical protein Ahy_B06g080711 [Arachis hypogaea]|uniref:Reverse transcriptase zinc-binding domain-containing protein n=1 Tax=Arachis hypogaea TaxID=3818 RepID=A0A444YIR4_ARAHY|nr:hypothetical protein Ahy_B06g080711 [Arachis hypogaea]
MTSEADCLRCNSNEATVLHAVRDCPTARLVWRALLPHQRNQHFFSLDIRDWICSNLEPITFGVGVSSLRYLRNKFVFEGSFTMSKDVATSIMIRAKEISN